MKNVYVIVERVEAAMRYSSDDYLAPDCLNFEFIRGVFKKEIDAKNRLCQYINSIKKDIRITQKKNGITFIVLEELENDVVWYHRLSIQRADGNKKTKVRNEKGDVIEIKLKKLKEVH